MAAGYISTHEAKLASGLRAIVVPSIPSPWSEAAKGLFHVKGISCALVRLDPSDPEQAAWAGEASAPVVFWERDPPVSAAAGIIALAQRIAPAPDLLPPGQAENILGLVSLLADRGGLGWQRRLQLIHSGLAGTGGFHPGVAAYLAPKYGYSAAAGAAAEAAVCGQLRRLAAALPSAGSYFFGNRISAADIYSAAFMALFAPLPEDLCPMHPGARRAFSHLTPAVQAALAPQLLAHRSRVYCQWLRLPVSI